VVLQDIELEQRGEGTPPHKRTLLGLRREKTVLSFAPVALAVSVVLANKVSRTFKRPQLKRIALVGLLCLVAVSAGGTTPREVEAATRPNVLFILTDDQDPDSLGRMDQLQSRLVDQGTRFPNAFVTTPQCCPSRATILRGQYAHNHGTLDIKPPTGGWEKFRSDGRERSTIATWLNAAGYTTGYMGKYLNGYGDGRTTTHVPRGWDRWWGWQGNYNEFGDFYKINENGEIRTYDRRQLHDTDYLSRKAEGFVRARRDERRPWFLVVATNAPHSPAFAAERHQDLFRKAKMPKPPSFNEADVSDKPEWIRNKPKLDRQQVAEAEEYWRQQQRALQSVDDLVGNVVGALADTSQLKNTYVVYASDNGYLLYRHRVESKGAPYEESIGVPLIVRGPRVPHGVVRGQIVSNTDWAPTIARWAQVQPPDFVDGRAFSPLLSPSPPPWRKRLLIEFFHSRDRSFRGVRTSDHRTYVHYDTGERELYRLDADPHQLRNTYRKAAPTSIAKLEDQLRALKNCARAECSTAEGF
jgi:N-acetylglucosamine-6-sulfatase